MFKGKRRPCICFLAILNRHAMYNLFPIMYDAGEMYVGEGFTPSTKGIPISSVCLQREFSKADLQPFIYVKHHEVHEDIVKLANRLLYLLVRRQERTTVYCGCKSSPCVPPGRMTWTKQVPSGTCKTCHVQYHQRCSSCHKPFDEIGGMFTSIPVEYFSTRHGIWKAFKSARQELYSSAFHCSQALHIRQGIIRATQMGHPRILEGVIQEGKDLKVRFRVCRVTEQVSDSCVCTWGRQRIGY